MKRKVKLEDSHLVPIVGDGAVANSFTAEGRAIPVLVLDCKNHKELLNLIYLHEHSPPGDVLCTWGINKENAYLLLEFSRPSEVSVGIKFNLETQGGLADGIIQSQGVYLQPSESGEHMAEGLDKLKTLVEVSPKTQIDDWDERLLAVIQKKMRREGMSRKHAKEASKQSLDRIREIWTLRMGDA